MDSTMPQLGETVTEGTITRWFKSVGDSVAADEVLFEVSTDKVDSEVPSPTAGTVTEILVPEGETVPVGAVLARVGDGAAAAAPAPAPPPPAPVVAVPSPAAGARDTAVPFSNIRRRTAEHMVRSKATSAHALVALEVDYHNVERVRLAEKDAFRASEGAALTYLP